MTERLGSTHVASDYGFGAEDVLNEGARRLLETGTRVIRVWMFKPKGSYGRNSDWPDNFANLVEMASHPYYRALFNKPYKVYVLTVYSLVSSNEHYFRTGVSTSQAEREAQAFDELTRYLMTKYNGTGKTFLLQHWEGDWALRGSFNSDPEADPSETAIAGMVDWLNARQQGVNRARNAVTGSDVNVFHASECNLVQIAIAGRPGVVNDVWPDTQLDLYGYSAYDTIGIAADDADPNFTTSRQRFREALNYMAAKAPDSAAFGEKNVYIGEFGWPEQDFGTTRAMRVIRMATEEALAWGCPYLVYWQLYDNECEVSGNPTNQQCRGYWMTKPDASHSAARDYFVSLLNPPPPPPTGRVLGHIRDASGQPVPTAVVFVTNTDSYVTQNSGAYGLKLPPGTYTLHVEHSYYQPRSMPGVAVTAGQDVVLDVTLDIVQPAPVEEFSVESGNQANTLGWTNPADSRHAGTMVRFSTSAHPVHPTDGELLIDQTGAPGALHQFHHGSLANAQSYYYTAFAYTNTPHRMYATGLQVTGTPAGPGDFDADGDVDQDDFGHFQSCYSGSAVHQDDPACQNARFDDDLDVDLNDFHMFKACMSGADILADPVCAE